MYFSKNMFRKINLSITFTELALKNLEMWPQLYAHINNRMPRAIYRRRKFGVGWVKKKWYLIMKAFIHFISIMHSPIQRTFLSLNFGTSNWQLDIHTNTIALIKALKNAPI